MKYWNQLDGSTFFNKVFTSNVEIGIVSLHSIQINNNNPEVSMGLDITDLPDNPPQKWLVEGFNTCRIGLRCGDVSNLVIKNLPNAAKLHMRISKIEDLFFISLKNDNTLIEFYTKYPLLGGPSVYIDGNTP